MNETITKNKAWALGALAMWSVASMADTTAATGTPAAAVAQPATSVTAAVPAATGSTFYGLADVRPTVSVVGAANAMMENWLEAGVQINPNVRLTYVAIFDNSLNSGAVKNDFKFYNGILRLKVKNVLESDDKSTSLNLQARLFTPTDSAERDKGFITGTRTYATLSKKFSDSVSMTLTSAPQLNFYSKTGFGTSANKGLLEHMLLYEVTLKIYGPVSFSMPILLQSAQYQNYQAGAKRNGALVNNLWTWPELGYAINDNHTVGLSFRTDNLAAEDLSKLTIGDGIDKGVAQIFWTGTF